MPDAQAACRVCGCALEGREVYEGICAACHEDEVLGRTPKPTPSRPRKKQAQAPDVAPRVDMDADTREIVPLAASGDGSPADHADGLVISLDADTPPHRVEPLEPPPPSEDETPGPEVLSLVSSSPAMEIPASAIPDLPLVDEPELPLDVDDEEEAAPPSVLSPPAPVIPAAPPTDEPSLGLKLHDEDASPTIEPPPEAPEHAGAVPDLQAEDPVGAPRLAIQQEEAAPASEGNAPSSEGQALRLAPADQSGVLTAIDRLRGRLNVLESRTEKLERRLLGTGGSTGSGFRAALGFAVGLIVVIAVLAGLTALVGLTVYAPALDFLQRLVAGAGGG